MTVTVRPRVLWQGPHSWVDVAYSSALGDSHAYVGPLPSNVLSPALTEAVAGRLRGVIEQASEVVGQVLAQNSTICSRCARTLMRSALGSPEDSAVIIAGGKPGDDPRYALAWRALGKHVQVVQAAMQQLRDEAVAGAVQPPYTPTCAVGGSGAGDDHVDLSLRVTGSPWAYLYEQAGWPMKAGQFDEYKLCACGDPTVDDPKIAMIVSGVPPVAESAPKGHDHVGGSACGCPHSGSPR